MERRGGGKKTVKSPFKPRTSSSLKYTSQSNNDVIEVDQEMIPFEGLLPWGIILTFLTAGGSYVSVSRYLTNDNKRVRYNLDQFEKQLIERDFRLTGKFRAQSDEAVAPQAFKTNGIWKLEKTSWWKD